MVRDYPRTIAIMQARMSSTRLPGKVLMPVAGRPMLAWEVERVKPARLVDELIIATSTNQHDDPVAELAEQLGVSCFRGSEDDVLDRYYQAAHRFKAEAVVRLSADNPLVDGNFVDWVVGEYNSADADYVAAAPGKDRGLPLGLAAEAFSFSALETSWREAKTPAWREHVTPYIRHNPDRFQVRYLTAPNDYSHLRLAVDKPEDLELIRRIFEHFGNGSFSWREAADTVKQHPEWVAINQDIP